MERKIRHCAIETLHYDEAKKLQDMTAICHSAMPGKITSQIAKNHALLNIDRKIKQCMTDLIMHDNAELS